MVELTRQRAKFCMSLTVWTLSLELARFTGWIPAGTRRMTLGGGDHVDTLRDVRHLLGWQTEYRSSDGQTVLAADAIQLSDCLTKAAANTQRIIDDLSSGQIPPLPSIRTEGMGFRWFTTPEGKTHLHNLAEFCRGGAFQIL